MRWGLVPHWSKQEDRTLSTFNARADHLLEAGSMWAKVRAKKRCIVLADGCVQQLHNITRAGSNNTMFVSLTLLKILRMDEERSQPTTLLHSLKRRQ
jgi:putative SOS response-associated peptidase YedK